MTLYGPGCLDHFLCYCWDRNKVSSGLCGLIASFLFVYTTNICVFKCSKVPKYVETKSRLFSYLKYSFKYVVQCTLRLGHIYCILYLLKCCYCSFLSWHLGPPPESSVPRCTLGSRRLNLQLTLGNPGLGWGSNPGAQRLCNSEEVDSEFVTYLTLCAVLSLSFENSDSFSADFEIWFCNIILVRLAT